MLRGNHLLTEKIYDNMERLQELLAKYKKQVEEHVTKSFNRSIEWIEKNEEKILTLIDRYQQDMDHNTMGIKNSYDNYLKAKKISTMEEFVYHVLHKIDFEGDVRNKYVDKVWETLGFTPAKNIKWGEYKEAVEIFRDVDLHTAVLNELDGIVFAQFHKKLEEFYKEIGVAISTLRENYEDFEDQNEGTSRWKTFLSWIQEDIEKKIFSY